MATSVLLSRTTAICFMSDLTSAPYLVTSTAFHGTKTQSYTAGCGPATTIRDPPPHRARDGMQPLDPILGYSPRRGKVGCRQRGPSGVEGGAVPAIESQAFLVLYILYSTVHTF